MTKRTTRCLSLLFLLWSSSSLLAQTDLPPKLYINGLGRSLIQSSELGGDPLANDTTTAKNLLDGEFLLDLKINASPNEKTEVSSILRLRNEFGGFFGSGMSIEVRELFARGVAGDIFRYHVGDMDLGLTPYTLHQAQQEGMVNEAELFKGRRELIDYEQFYQRDGKRRMQGGKFDLALSAGSVFPEVNLTGFFTRNRGTDFFNLPSRFVGGGRIELINLTYGTLRGNYVNTYDALSIGGFDMGIRNSVISAEADLDLWENDALALGFTGEIGLSSLIEVQVIDSATRENSVDRGDSFAEGALELEVKEQDLKLALGFMDVGPDFFSIAAQSKRVDFDRTITQYSRIGNDRRARQTSVFDLNRDRALYTFGLSDVLMAYDPRLSNTMPYGKATPNRRGVTFDANYGTDSSVVELGLQSAFLSEIRGQGTDQLKSFTLVRLSGDLNIHELIDREETLKLTLGYQFEQTNRDGTAAGNNIEEINLASNLLDLGLEVELFTNFDLLLGAKILQSSGNEFVPQIVRFNEVQDFPGETLIDDNEQLLGAGIRYRFKKGVFLSAQIDSFNYSSPADPNSDYQVNQIFVLYNMNF